MIGKKREHEIVVMENPFEKRRAQIQDNKI